MPHRPVVFTDASITPNGISAWRWDFGDSVTSTLQNPSHQYTAVGPHTVALTIDSGLEADRATQVITIGFPRLSGQSVKTQYTVPGKVLTALRVSSKSRANLIFKIRHDNQSARSHR